MRFGNVLGSSGSVIPSFKRQIAKGGPVTVTDPELTRYFMSIEEAAQLILQDGAMGKGGDGIGDLLLKHTSKPLLWETKSGGFARSFFIIPEISRCARNDNMRSK